LRPIVPLNIGQKENLERCAPVNTVAAMIIGWAIAIYRRASLPRLIAMQKRVLAETMIKATVAKGAALARSKPLPPKTTVFLARSGARKMRSGSPRRGFPLATPVSLSYV